MDNRDAVGKKNVIIGLVMIDRQFEFYSDAKLGKKRCFFLSNRRR